MDANTKVSQGDVDSYHGFVPSSANGARISPPPPDSVAGRILEPCLAVWDRASGGPGSNAAKTYQGTDPTDAILAKALPPIWALNDAVKKYFARSGDAQVDADRITVGPGMVLGDLDLVPDPSNPTGPKIIKARQKPPQVDGFTRAAYLGSPNPPRGYGSGIIGFNRILVQKMFAATLPTVQPTLKDGNGQTFSATILTGLKDDMGRPHKIRWSVFGFGSDLMHFDILHPPGVRRPDGLNAPPHRDDVLAAQTVADALMLLTQSDGQNPWLTRPKGK